MLHLCLDSTHGGPQVCGAASSPGGGEDKGKYMAVSLDLLGRNLSTTEISRRLTICVILAGVKYLAKGFLGANSFHLPLFLCRQGNFVEDWTKVVVGVTSRGLSCGELSVPGPCLPLDVQQHFLVNQLSNDSS